MRLNKFEFGDQTISQFVIFECKWLFSIIIFYFHKSEGSQDRYHTHAFNAWSIKLWGSYLEYKLKSTRTGNYNVKKRTNIFQYFPRNRYHKIGNSNGCCTILLSGPWNRTWKEFDKNKAEYTLSWGRK